MSGGSVDANIRDILAGLKNGGARFQFADGPNIDGNGRLRVANPVNLFLNKNVHSKNDNLWEEPVTGAIIEHGAVTGGVRWRSCGTGQTRRQSNHRPDKAGRTA